MPCDCEQSTLNVKPETINVQKESTETITVEVPWCPALNSGVTIDTSVWVVLDGDCTLSNEVLSGFVTRCDVSAGTPGQLCRISNTIETDTGLPLVQVIECYISSDYEPVIPHC